MLTGCSALRVHNGVKAHGKRKRERVIYVSRV